MDLSTTIANQHLPVPIYNASGSQCTTLNQLRNIERSYSAVVLTKSCTVDPRKGNSGTRYWDDDNISINSTGLANLGYEQYIQFSKQFSKPYFLSIAGLTLDDNLTMIKEINDNFEHIHAIELNLSCPNLEGKAEIAYDFNSEKGMSSYLRHIFEEVDIPLGLKLPPYPNNYFWDSAADIINEYPISFVTCINSIGHCIVVDPKTDKTVIHPNGGHGGMGGNFIKPVALANVKKMRERLRSKIDIIGCGGVRTGRDVYDHILCGASAVQVGSALMKEGVGVFLRLKQELEREMYNKGYSSLLDFRGKIETCH